MQMQTNVDGDGNLELLARLQCMLLCDCGPANFLLKQISALRRSWLETGLILTDVNHFFELRNHVRREPKEIKIVRAFVPKQLRYT
jgi:hypothetical protein